MRGDPQAGSKEQLDQQPVLGLLPAGHGLGHAFHFLDGEVGNDAESFGECAIARALRITLYSMHRKF